MIAALRRSRAAGGVRSLFGRSAPFRFLLVGGFNTLACYLVYALLVSLGLDYKLANFASLLFGICLNFVLQGRFVFRDRDPRRFAAFAAFWFVIYCVQTGVIGGLMQFGIGPRLAGLIVLPGTAVLSYLAGKYLVFRGGRA